MMGLLNRNDIEIEISLCTRDDAPKTAKVKLRDVEDAEHMAALAAKMERLNATRDAEIGKLRASAQALRGHGVSLTGSTATIQSAIRRTEQYN
ncbi:hypothetical protein [Symbiopectobacterium sp. RP]|uniref:hypothetical protein n=1 Tax=Symbiopectobacterium sp. RP TaxID=3248553 RepID=UPI003D2B2BFC